MVARLVGLLAGALMATASNAQTPPAISVGITPNSANEGARFQVSFTRTGDLTKISSVAWRVSGAVDGADFGLAAPPSGTINFTAGQAKKGFPLTPSDDAVAEPNELFDVTLSSPVNATISTGKASATILNNDLSARAPLAVVNVGASSFWSYEDAFLNHFLVGGRFYDQWVKDGLFDNATGRFVKMPASGSPFLLTTMRGGITVNPGHYKGKWILDWQGDGDLWIETGSAGSVTRISANRVEEFYDPAIHGNVLPAISIHRIGPAGVSNIRYYRASHEPLVAAGKMFDPRWLADMARFDAMRFLDWTGVNGDYELKASDRPLPSRPGYFNGRAPDRAIIRAAIESGTNLWLNAPALLGCPPNVAATLRNSAIAQSARIAAVAAAFDQIMASSEPLLWARAIVAELNAQSYPVARPIFVEFDNEVWNSKFRVSTEYARGIGQTVIARSSGLSGTTRVGYGYLSARYAAAFAQALAEGGRPGQSWTMVLAAQTADVASTRQAISGARAFGGSVPMSRYGVATTNYYSGGFSWNAENLLFGAKLDAPTWRQRWKAEFAADPAALRQKINSFFLSPTSLRGNVAYYGVQARAHKAAAEASGARWIGNYEGDSHDILDVVLTKDPAIIAFFSQWHESADHGRVITAIADETRKIDPKAMIANYLFCAGPRTPASPWAECAPWDQTGGDNAAWDGILMP